MRVDMLNENIKRLESIFINIMYLKPESEIIRPIIGNLEEIKEGINAIFDENKCLEVIYTHNTDKPFFGIRINPSMSSSDLSVILFSEDKVRLNRFQIEYDSKLFELGLSAAEITALTIYEVSSIMDSPEIFDTVRGLVDFTLINNDDVLSIRNSINQAQLIIFALKDTMYKIGSFMFKEDPKDLAANTNISIAGLSDIVVEAKSKIMANEMVSNSFSRTANISILEWMLAMYHNIKVNFAIINDTLNDAKAFTASKLELSEIEKTIDALNRIDDNVIFRESVTNLTKFLESTAIGGINELSLFKNLKKNGLRGIENELYEYAMRVKNCTESDDAYLIMRGINSRLSILEDYLATEPLNDNDRRHWEDVANQYRELRVKLSNKKFNTKQYGLFYNYSELDEEK